MSEVQNPTEWRDRLRLRLEDMIDEFVVDGVDHHEVFDAVVTEVAGLRDALDRDPDPSEEEGGDALAEPANDWPAAE